jgi:hypothetical protein
VYFNQFRLRSQKVPSSFDGPKTFTLQVLTEVQFAFLRNAQVLLI